MRDWPVRFGHALLLVETFVDPVRFHGTVYQAANWVGVHVRLLTTGLRPSVTVTRPLASAVMPLRSVTVSVTSKAPACAKS